MKSSYTNDDTFLARWLENKLTDEELAYFKQTDDYELFHKIASKSTVFKIPSFDKEKTLQEIKAKIEQRKTKVRRIIPAWFYATAAAVLLVVGLTFFFNQNTSYNSLSGEQLAFVLPDGSEVQLNGESKLSYSEKDWKKGVRSLQLDGEGYFKVKKGSDFSVNTGNGVVTVLGTQFNVQSVENFLAVECYEGKVRVKNSEIESVLTPGKGVKVIEKSKELYSIEKSQPNWISYDFRYNAVPLKVVFRDLENLYNVKIKNKDVDLDKKYSGILVIDNLDKALKIICKSMNINYEVKDKQVIIYN